MIEMNDDRDGSLFSYIKREGGRDCVSCLLGFGNLLVIGFYFLESRK